MHQPIGRSPTDLRLMEKIYIAEIARIESNLSEARTKLLNVQNFLNATSPVEMTHEEIEEALGHKVVIKEPSS